METVNGWTYIVLLLVFSPAIKSLYLITDYYMDDGWPKAFGQVCGKTIKDDCLYLNSHLNSLGALNYDDDISCVTQLNAGSQRGARYKLWFKRFELEYSNLCDSDYLTIFDTRMGNTSFTAPLGKFCGYSKPNITGYPTQQYVSLRFKTDGSTGRKGFRIMATRTLPYPCYADAFHCKAENRCIDGRLQCDGTVQCDDETDEDDCSFWEKVIGGFLALGVSTMVGILFLIVLLCTGVCLTVCCCTCCKKQGHGCRKCCCAICKPGKTCVKGVRKKIGSAKVGSKVQGDVISKNDEAANADETGGSQIQRTKVLPVKSLANNSVLTTDENVPSKATVTTKTMFQSDDILKTPSRNGTVFDSNVVNADVTTTVNDAENGVTKVD